jgi:thiamine monophosphate kinase
MDELKVPLVDSNGEADSRHDPLETSLAGLEPFELVVTAASNESDRQRLDDLAQLDPAAVRNAFLQHAAILLYEGRLRRG